MIKPFRLLIAAAAFAAAAPAAMAQTTPASAPAAASTADDPNLWLEDVLGDKALGWVREQPSGGQPVG